MLCLALLHLLCVQNTKKPPMVNQKKKEKSKYKKKKLLLFLEQSFFYPAVSSFPFVTLLSSSNCLSFLVPLLSFILLSSLHCLSFLVLLLSELGHFTSCPSWIVSCLWIRADDGILLPEAIPR